MNVVFYDEQIMCLRHPRDLLAPLLGHDGAGGVLDGWNTVEGFRRRLAARHIQGIGQQSLPVHNDAPDAQAQHLCDPLHAGVSQFSGHYGVTRPKKGGEEHCHRMLSAYRNDRLLGCGRHPGTRDPSGGASPLAECGGFGIIP